MPAEGQETAAEWKRALKTAEEDSAAARARAEELVAAVEAEAEAFELARGSLAAKVEGLEAAQAALGAVAAAAGLPCVVRQRPRQRCAGG